MRQQKSDEDQGADEFLLQEYEQFISSKAEGTINTHVRATCHVMEWIAQRPSNGGRFHPQQLTKTVVEVYLTSLEQEGFSLNHQARVKSTISSFALWLMEEKGLLQRNPTRGVNLPSQQVLAPRQLSEDQRYTALLARPTRRSAGHLRAVSCSWFTGISGMNSHVPTSDLAQQRRAR